MDIVRVGPDSELVEGLVAFGRAVVAVDSPWAHPATPARLRGLLAHGWDGEPPSSWVGLEDGEVVAAGGLWASSYDNLRSGWLDLAVLPGHRRRGLGSELLRHLEQEAARRGRTVLGTNFWESEAGHSFVTAARYVQGSTSAVRRQRLDRLPEGWREQVAQARSGPAAAYELVRVRGAVPEDLIEAFAELWAAINDAPNDDLVVEDEVFPVERIRGYERAQLPTNRLYHLIAVHRPDGQLAGHTIVAVDTERPSLGSQHDTTVAPAHRGHRLGLVLKGEMMSWLLADEPALREVETQNAESNAHMIAVNDALGYEVVGRRPEYQKIVR
ncbi:GNAT family N-acetyltransferase [Ornithinimicrobium cerasi]|uniref:Acetyltransferase (GNAT) family protein n=1 Tax=Ornithinimicrobium cerasi TaxID=2248773 RepID=A0A285VVH1_9MICO|nr:GNAT family N-acetyltransferase [Ornithinimicrobium cerasi]SOC57246.1 Acetyltransferase (GNAT) family protein [Ornithinimicrobium cerasi]